MICSSDVKTAVIARTIIFVKKKKKTANADYEKKNDTDIIMPFLGSYYRGGYLISTALCL